MNAKVAIFAAVLCLSGLGASNPVLANELAAKPDAPSRVVRFGDLDLATSAGVHSLYSRMNAAAWKVCGEIFPVDNGPTGIQNAKCRRSLIDTTIADVNLPALTALHAGSRTPATARR